VTVTYILIRKDLKMRRGKEIAQACHAVLGLGLPDAATVTLQCEDKYDLSVSCGLAAERGWPYFIVRDAGHTEVKAGTMTCAAISAPRGAFDNLKLY